MQRSTKTFNALHDFKMNELRSFKTETIQKYGWDFFSIHLSSLFETFECELETILEETGEQSIQDEDLNYEPFLEE